ncbi:hypothetical protein GCM10027088_56700 [Nocardia goodfellowii]
MDRSRALAVPTGASPFPWTKAATVHNGNSPQSMPSKLPGMPSPYAGSVHRTAAEVWDGTLIGYGSTIRRVAVAAMPLN